ncbi:MAG: C-GCAxxG-C-C family protein [Clostridiales bacterium]|nr:C-GCAxxG-C-C family protein [Clostridiales bacterium]
MAELIRTERVERAIRLHLSGYNCAQAVLCAFCDVTGADERTLLRAASDLGGGLSGSHENACGAVTGMLVAYGLIDGYDDVTDLDRKKQVYENGQKLISRFREEFGSLTCAVLKDEIAPGFAGRPHALVTEEAPKPCSKFVAAGAAILDAFLKEKENEKNV